MDNLKNYIKLVEIEIEKEIEKEIEYGITQEGEEDLHVLFENCKHAKEMLCMYEHQGKLATVATK